MCAGVRRSAPCSRCIPGSSSSGKLWDPTPDLVFKSALSTVYCGAHLPPLRDEQQPACHFPESALNQRHAEQGGRGLRDPHFATGVSAHFRVTLCPWCPDTSLSDLTQLAPFCEKSSWVVVGCVWWCPSILFLAPVIPERQGGRLTITVVICSLEWQY